MVTIPIPFKATARPRLRRVAAALFLAGSLAAAPPATAQTTAAAPLQMPQQAGYYRFKLGAVNVTAFSDGTVPQELHELLTNTTPAEVDQLLSRARMPYPVEASVNAYLLELGSRLVLVDAGAGDLLGPTLGHLPAAMQAAGYQPAQVTDVLITHIHTDHTGGLMAGSQRVFPNATLHLSQPELDFWLSEANLKAAPAASKKHFLEARAKVAPYVAAGKVQPFTGNGDLWPGLRTVASPGHTPGHTFYALESQGQKLLFWGDMMHVAAVQFAKPGITIVYDVRPEQAATTRAQAYAEAAKQGYWVAIDHVSFPGIGHLRASGAGYDWLPVNYSTYATGQ